MVRPKPIYSDAQQHWPGFGYQRGHKGLWFTRFYDGFKDDWEVDDVTRRRWLESLEGPCGDREALGLAAVRQIKLGRALHGASRVFETQWNFVTGLGLPHPVENGFAWHPTLGTPYLCGAAVKGLLRAWVEEEADLEEKERQARAELWFGKPEQCGELIFFDTFPVETAAVGTDVMTPHMGRWYEQGGAPCGAGDAKNVEPADWHSPIPVLFLVVRKARFLFTIAPRHAARASEAEAAMDALERALEELGAGAKTAAGYGDMSPDPTSFDRLQEQIAAAEKQRARERQLADMTPFQRSLEKVIEQAEQNNTAAEVALIKRLERGEWEGEDALRVAEKARAIMQAKGTWRPESKKRRPDRDWNHQRTLTVLRILGGS